MAEASGSLEMRSGSSTKIIGLRQQFAAAGQRAEASCVITVAAPRGEGGNLSSPRILDHQGLEVNFVGAEEIGDVEFARGARLDADGGVVELGGAFHIELLGRQEALQPS